jgi:PH domain
VFVPVCSAVPSHFSSQATIFDSDEDADDGEEAYPTMLHGDEKTYAVATLNQISHLSKQSLVHVKEGFMVKLGGFIKSWRSRYFTLESTVERRTVKYYKSIESEKHVGEIAITSSTIVTCEPDDAYVKPFAIGVVPEKGSRKYVLVADSDDLRQQWFVALQAATKGYVDICGC